MLTKELRFDGREMKLLDVQLPAPSGVQALVRAEFSNVSIGTETAYMRLARMQGKPAPALGYALVGMVVEAGSAATVKPGKRVLVLAPHGGAVIVQDAPGSIVPVPAGLDSASATFGTMASIAMHAVQRAEVKIGEKAIVFGCGVLGALTAQLLALSGAGVVAVAEPNERRRRIAHECGVGLLLNPRAEDVASMLDRLGTYNGVDLVIETAGHASVFPGVLDVLRVGGRLVCTSTFLEELKVRLYPDIVERELTLIGAHQPKCPVIRVPYYPYSQSENRQMGLRLMTEGKLKVGPLITHRIHWEEAPRFYGRLEQDMSICGAVIDWTGAAR